MKKKLVILCSIPLIGFAILYILAIITNLYDDIRVSDYIANNYDSL